MNLLAGDINLNPGPNPGPNPFSDLNLSFDSIDDELSSDELLHNSSADGSQRKKNSGLDVLYLNARSVKSVTRKKRINKIRDYCAIQSKKLYDIICTTETWLNSNVSDAELSDSDYVLYRKDRSGHWKTRGGGLLCAIKSSIMSLRRLDLEHVNDEIMVLEIRPNKCKKMALVLCYREPDSPVDTFVQNLQSALSKVATEFDQFHIIGDFNLPKINGCRNLNVPPAEMAFCDVINSFLLTQLNFIPSRVTCDNILDLIFTTSPDRVSNVYISSESFTTDHKLLEFCIITKVERLRKVKRRVYNFKKANFNQIRSDLNSTGTVFANVFSAGTVNTAWSNFKHIFTTVLDKHIPKIIIKDSSTPAWIDSEVRHLQNKKYTSWKRAKKTNSEHHWSKFKKLRNRLKNLITAKYDQYIDGFGATLIDNPKRFWSFFRSKTRSKSLPQVISDTNGITATSSKEKATLFNNYFFSVFTQPKDHMNLPNIPFFEHESLGDILYFKMMMCLIFYKI